MSRSKLGGLLGAPVLLVLIAEPAANPALGRVETLVVGGGPVGFRSITPPLLNNREQVAFHATEAIFDIFTGTTVTKEGFFRASSGGVQAIVHEGDAAGAGGGNFMAFNPLQYALNDAGDVAFEAFLTGTGVRQQDHAIYRGVPGSLHKVTVTGHTYDTSTISCLTLSLLIESQTGQIALNHGRENEGKRNMIA